jgi:hypothetical protein
MADMTETEYRQRLNAMIEREMKNVERVIRYEHLVWPSIVELANWTLRKRGKTA